MHYCIHLFTKELPTETEINDILSPFNSEEVFKDDEEQTEYPAFTWDYFLIGGRYGGALKLKIQTEEDDEYRWRFYERNPREGRLFHSSLLRKIRERFVDYESREEDWLRYMGDASFIYCDGAKIKDLVSKDTLGCYGFVDIDGTAYAREQWTGNGFIKHDDFDERYQKTLNERSDCFLTVLDIHD